MTKCHVGATTSSLQQASDPRPLSDIEGSLRATYRRQRAPEPDGLCHGAIVAGRITSLSCPYRCWWSPSCRSGGRHPGRRRLDPPRPATRPGGAPEALPRVPRLRGPGVAPKALSDSERPSIRAAANRLGVSVFVFWGTAQRAGISIRGQVDQPQVSASQAEAILKHTQIPSR
jgi:hypothetical protein